MKIKNTFRAMVALAFITMWFMHITQPTKKSYKAQLTELKKHTYYQKRTSRLKVVFGG